MLVEHDSAGFAQAYRGPRAELPEWALREPDAIFDHFQALLAPPPDGSSGRAGMATAAVAPAAAATAVAATAAPRLAEGPALEPRPLPTPDLSPTLPPHPLAALLPVSPWEEDEEEGRHAAEGVRMAPTCRNWAEPPPDGAFPASPREVGARAGQERRNEEAAAAATGEAEGMTPPPPATAPHPSPPPPTARLEEL